MKINRKFNTLTVKEYLYFIDHYKKYTDFNTLGLYRSLLENTNLTNTEKIEVREYAHKIFTKSFDFMKVKDPHTFLEVSILGQELTKADQQQLWNTIKKNQQKILADKRIKHRNFGQYSKHNCGYETCHLNGIMIKQGSRIGEMQMYFTTDRNSWSGQFKSIRRKSDRKRQKQMIAKELENEG